MPKSTPRTICWRQLWNERLKGVGLEHLLLSERDADSVLVAFDEQHGPFRLTYHLTWDESWQIREARLNAISERTVVASQPSCRSMQIASFWIIRSCSSA